MMFGAEGEEETTTLYVLETIPFRPRARQFLLKLSFNVHRACPGIAHVSLPAPWHGNPSPGCGRGLGWPAHSLDPPEQGHGQRDKHGTLLLRLHDGGVLPAPGPVCGTWALGP